MLPQSLLLQIYKSVVITASRFDGPFDVTIGYAQTAGIATVAEGLTGTPDITVGTNNSGNITPQDINSRDINSRHINSSGVVTATSFVGDGSGLDGVGGGLGNPVTGTDGMFNAVALSTTFNSTVNLNDATSGVGSHYVTVTSPILELGPSGDVTVGTDKVLVIDPLPLPPWS